MIKNNITMLFVQIALSIICLTVDLIIAVNLGDRPLTDTVVSWLNLVVYVFFFFLLGKTKLDPQGHPLKNAGSVLFISGVSFFLMLLLSNHFDQMNHLISLMTWVLILPVGWAQDVKHNPLAFRSLFVFIPAIAAFVGLTVRPDKQSVKELLKSMRTKSELEQQNDD
ncbi:hypothetical protein ACFVR2_25040 [Gottfriedia sp. NPDC057991]|uniref:hypothetical protein n=1 Tax=Gottfriedia sp. NPDC057991 TaxID=3346298 RepID=UPI0036D99DCA